MSTGALFPWGTGFLEKLSPLPERFYLGGNSSPFSSLGGPTSLFGLGQAGWAFRWQTDDNTELLLRFLFIYLSNGVERVESISMYMHVEGMQPSCHRTSFCNFSFQNPLKSNESSIGA